MPASGKLIADFNPARAAGEKLTSFLRERVFSKNTTIHASVPLSKRLIFVKEPGTNKPREELNATAAEMERTAVKAVINLVEVSQLVDLPQLLEHRVVEGCMVLFNSDVTFRKTQTKFSLQYVYLQEPYVALVDMGMTWRMATPTAEDRQTQGGTLYK